MRRMFAIVLSVLFMISMGSNVHAATVESTVDVDLEVVTTATHSRAIIIIPGIMGSSLYNTTNSRYAWNGIMSLENAADLYLDDNGNSVKAMSLINETGGAFNTYGTLYDELTTAFSDNFDIIFFSYDWRMNNTVAASRLASVAAPYSEVVLVAHSMGGLVASKFLANSSANRAKTSALITIGTPFVGSAKCIDVMESGELVKNPVNGSYLVTDVVKKVCGCSYAAYQLLPTTNYRNITGYYPISINGTNYSDCAMLVNASWGHTPAGTVKPMVEGAYSFHNSLYIGNTFVLDYYNIPVYTLAGSLLNTVSKVNLNSNYYISSLSYSNSGDGTVLLSSAGYGTPDYYYNYVEHTDLVSHDTAIDRIKVLITTETGISAAIAANEQMDTTEKSSEIQFEELEINDRGWILGYDNRRINIIVDQEIEIYCGSTPLTVVGRIYDTHGNVIGDAWHLDDSGRMQYVLNNGNYEFSIDGYARIEYLNNGYYDLVYEFNTQGEATVFIEDYSEAPSCLQNSNMVLPTSIADEQVLTELNTD